MIPPTVYRAAWVVPVTTPPVRDGAVRVDGDGRIGAVGPANAVEMGDADVVDLGAAALIPGLINVHGHPELSVLRGRLHGLEFPAWITALIDYKYRHLTPEELEVSTRLGVAEAIAAGVTCLAAPDDAGFLMQAMIEAGLRGRVYRETFGPDPDCADAALTDLRTRVTEMRRWETDRVQVGISPHATYTVSRPLFERLAEYARAEDLPVCVHVAESAAETMFVREGAGPFADRLRVRGIAVEAAGVSSVEFLAETGILDVGPLLAHAVQVDAADIQRIVDAGAAVAHCPIANANFGHGLAPLPELLAAGVRVGLGSDSVASNDRVDILEEARFTSLAHRAVRRDGGLLPADRALRLATLDGARALGLDDRIGSLEKGKDADLVAVRLSTPNATPTGDPAAALIHAARGADVCLTIVAGRPLYRDGDLLTLDWRALAEEAERIDRGLRDV